MLYNALIGSKHLKNDLEKTVQYEPAHLLCHSMFVCEISCHFELARWQKLCTFAKKIRRFHAKTLKNGSRCQIN